MQSQLHTCSSGRMHGRSLTVADPSCSHRKTVPTFVFVQVTEVPLVVDDASETLQKTSAAVALLKKVGFTSQTPPSWRLRWSLSGHCSHLQQQTHHINRSRGIGHQYSIVFTGMH